MEEAKFSGITRFIKDFENIVICKEKKKYKIMKVLWEKNVLVLLLCSIYIFAKINDFSTVIANGLVESYQRPQKCPWYCLA